MLQIPNIYRIRLIPLITSLFVWSCQASLAKLDAVQTHPTDPYFTLDHVLDVSINIPVESWNELRYQTRGIVDIIGGTDCLDSPPEDIFSWFQARVTVDGESHNEVGVRKKGFLGSLSDEKPALKIRFDKFIDNQLLGGVVKRLTLNNVQQDKSMLSTCMTYYVFAAAGIPAPRCNFATVSVNGENLGLYVHVESIKTSFLEQHFANTEGNLYEGAVSDFHPLWRGTFEKKTNKKEANWSDIDAVINAMQDTSAAGLKTLATLVDIDQFLSFWATEVLVGHWDGYAGNRNNFYIYHEPDAPLVFIPWGADNVFSSTDGPFDDFKSPPAVMAHGAIANRLYRVATTRQAYITRFKEILDLAWNEKELLALVDQMATIVQIHALVETRSAAARDTQRIRQFINRRRNEILENITPQPPTWPETSDVPDICWPEKGIFDLSFETTWGSNDNEDPLTAGKVTFTEYQWDGEQQNFTQLGAVAGKDKEDEDNSNRAEINIFGLTSDALLDVLAIDLPIERLISGSLIPFADEQHASGWHLILSPPYIEPELFEFIGTGGIKFTHAGTEPGDKIAGRLYGKIFSFNQRNNSVSTNEPNANSTPKDPTTRPRADIGLVINEIAAKGDPLDWFELYNDSENSIALGDMVLADDLTDINKRVAFPEDMTIAAGDYLLVQLDKDVWPGFAFNSDEELGIWTADGRLIDYVDWEEGQAATASSFARIPNIVGDFQTVENPTPGRANQVNTAIITNTNSVPKVSYLQGNWPNPFNSTTVIGFELKTTTSVHLIIYDMLGRIVCTLYSGEKLLAGQYHTIWDGLDDQGRATASGIYLYQLVTGTEFTAVGRMALLR